MDVYEANKGRHSTIQPVCLQKNRCRSSNNSTPAIRLFQNIKLNICLNKSFKALRGI